MNGTPHGTKGSVQIPSRPRYCLRSTDPRMQLSPPGRQPIPLPRRFTSMREGRARRHVAVCGSALSLGLHQPLVHRVQVFGLSNLAGLLGSCCACRWPSSTDRTSITSILEVSVWHASRTWGFAGGLRRTSPQRGSPSSAAARARARVAPPLFGSLAL